jgi:poly(beta-D-mannuronate) lyase
LTTAYTGQGDSESIDRYHSDWLGITGSSVNIKIDHNVFQNKTTRGVFLLVLGEGNNIVQKTVVDHNRFSDHSYQHGNGGECIRVGFSGMGTSKSYSIFEYNTFERCNGDSETISVKSSNNTFRYNTFKNNYGSLVFRHGSDNVADGNIFINGRNGIRAYGANQVIINNYLANNPITTVGVSNPIVIGRATVSDDLSGANAEYSQSRNILIAHNTLVGNHVNIVIGAFSGSYLPEDITLVNNIITSNSGSLVQVLNGTVTFSNNILYPTEAATIGDVPPSGYVNVNPLLADSGDIMRPAAASPAIDAIAPSDAYGVTRDVDGQIRSERFDIGADEVG